MASLELSFEAFAFTELTSARSGARPPISLRTLTRRCWMSSARALAAFSCAWAAWAPASAALRDRAGAVLPGGDLVDGVEQPEQAGGGRNEGDQDRALAEPHFFEVGFEK